MIVGRATADIAGLLRLIVLDSRSHGVSCSVDRTRSATTCDCVMMRRKMRSRQSSETRVSVMIMPTGRARRYGSDSTQLRRGGCSRIVGRYDSSYPIGHLLLDPGRDHTHG